MIDTRSGTLLKQVPIGGHPTAISVDQANHDLFTFDDGILTETSPDLGKSSHYNAPKASTGGVVAVDSNTHIVYVLAGDTLTSINPRANTSAEIRLPSRATLSDLAIDSRLHRAHVISSNGDQQLFFVNTDTNSLIGSTTVGFGPGGADISVDQSTHTVYIAKTDNNNGSSGDINGQLLAIEWANGTTSVGPGPAVVLGPTASATKTTPPETAVPTRGASPTTAGGGDASFLSALQGAGVLSNVGYSGLMQAALAECNALTQGSDIHAQANILLKPPYSLTAPQAGFVAGEAIKSYCPRFSSQLASDATVAPSLAPQSQETTPSKGQGKQISSPPWSFTASFLKPDGSVVGTLTNNSNGGKYADFLTLKVNGNRENDLSGYGGRCVAAGSSIPITFSFNGTIGGEPHAIYSLDRLLPGNVIDC